MADIQTVHFLVPVPDSEREFQPIAHYQGYGPGFEREVARERDILRARHPQLAELHLTGPLPEGSTLEFRLLSTIFAPRTVHEGMGPDERNSARYPLQDGVR